MSRVIQIFKGSTAGTINADVYLASEKGFAIEVINNSTGSLTLTLQAAIDDEVRTYSNVLDPLTGEDITITCTAGAQVIVPYVDVIPHCIYRVTGTLASGTVDTIIKAVVI